MPKKFSCEDYHKMLAPPNKKGPLCLDPLSDKPDELRTKIEILFKLIQKSKCILVLTGAGISQSSGILDFRGVVGIYIREELGLFLEPRLQTGFQDAKPTIAHKVLAELEKAGRIQYHITLNVDDLHRKVGLCKKTTIQLHGNVFEERCEECGRVCIRDEAIESVGFKFTGRYCSRMKQGKPCNGRLVDTCMDWNQAYRPDVLKKSYKWLEKCDLLICVGISFEEKISGSFPYEVFGRGEVVSINVHKTKLDDKMTLAIYETADTVFRRLAEKMGLPVDPEIKIEVVDLTADDEDEDIQEGHQNNQALDPENVDLAMEEDDHVREV